MSSHSHALLRFQQRHRACTACADAGYIDRAHPVFSGSPGQRILLVGQAPGPVEIDQSRPFAGRAGRQLMRWLGRAGLGDEDEIRQRVYFTAMTTCFPGRTADNRGDRRPSAREVALCRHWLDGVMDHLEPRLVIPVGTLALGRFLPGGRLDDVVGQAFDATGHEARAGVPTGTWPVFVPLPHPSGQSRWLNDPSRVARLDQALVTLERWVGMAYANAKG